MKHAKYEEALLRILSVTPVEHWPAHYENLFFATTFIMSKERLILTTFLYGNGARAEDLLPLLQHRLRDNDAVRDIQDKARAFEDPDRRQTYHYFDATLCDTLTFDNKPHGAAYGGRVWTRKMNNWDAFAFKHSGVTLAMQESFFAQNDCDDAHMFFRM